MNISYNWLKDVIDHGLSPDELAAQLTRVGLAVEGVHPHGDDFALDIDLTSNRPDCLSHLGIARELRVITREETRAVASVPVNKEASSDLVTIQDPDLCYRFTARTIRNVKVGPSPQWLVDRLEALGERSINNVADITNYVMLELGQPMHAFDLDKLAGGRLVVRRATGEKITTLKEEEKALDNSVIAVCDAESPVAIGGVIGGLDSSITDTTTNVLLEVAYFDRSNIRATSRKLGIATEASYRFERGVDIEALKLASDRATQLICELAGGKPGEFIDLYPNKIEAATVESKDLSASVKRLTGLDVEQGRCVEILDRLGIRSSSPTTFIPPTWRHDIAIDEDLVEEIARHAGYENIAAELPPAYGAGEYQPNELRKRRLRLALVDMGFDEAISYSFIPTDHDGTYASIPQLVDTSLDEQHVTLQDSVIEGAVRMRPSILPGLLGAVRHNFNHQHRVLKLFEIGTVFAADKQENGLPKEVESLAMVVTGGEISGDRVMAVRDLDFYDAKGSLESALQAVGLTDIALVPSDIKHLAKGQAAAISVDRIEIGSVGRLSDDIASGYKFKQPVFVAEIDLSAVLALSQSPVAYRPLSIYPGVTRDVSLIAKRDVSFAEIGDAIRELGFELCRSVSFVDLYEGKGLAEDERSVTIRLEYRSDERTLVETGVDEVHERIIKEVEEKLGVKPRS